MAKIINQWQFSVDVEGLKLVNITSSYTVSFLRRYVAFIAESNDIFIVNNLATNNQMRLDRNECTVPAPGVDMDSFLDSLATLASV